MEMSSLLPKDALDRADHRHRVTGNGGDPYRNVSEARRVLTLAAAVQLRPFGGRTIHARRQSVAHGLLRVMVANATLSLSDHTLLGW